MEVLIVGAGVIGSTFGWALTQAGNRVTHLVKPGRAAQYLDGMQVDILDRRKNQNKSSRPRAG